MTGTQNGFTHKPFEVLKNRPTPPSLKGPGFDLEPAYKALEHLPEGYRKKENVEKRVARARELLFSNGTLRHREVDAILRNEFGGVGISGPKFNRLRDNFMRQQKNKEKKQMQAKVQENTPPVSPWANGGDMGDAPGTVPLGVEMRAYAADRLRVSPSMPLGKHDGGLSWLLMQRFGCTLLDSDLVQLKIEIQANQQQAINALKHGPITPLAAGTQTVKKVQDVVEPAVVEPAVIEPAAKAALEALFREHPALISVLGIRAGETVKICYQVSEVVTKEIK